MHRPDETLRRVSTVSTQESPGSEPSPLNLALGRVPSGLFILTCRHGGRSTGLLVSWVQQAGFEPPMLTVALRQDRYSTDWVAASGRFVLNQVAAGHKKLLRHFARGFEPGLPAFDGLEIRSEAEGGPVLNESLSYLEASLVDHIDSGDHRLFLARILAGAVFEPGLDPMVHVRHSGHHY